MTPGLTIPTGPTCNRILVAFYRDGRTTFEIARDLDLTEADVVDVIGEYREQRYRRKNQGRHL